MLRTAVIGTGYLGKFHAEEYARLPTSTLIGVADIDETQGQQVANDCDTQYFNHYHDLIDKVDADSVVVPTSSQYETAREFLRAGVHVLVEKLMATNTRQAEDMIALAQQKNVILQVGFLECYNAALNSISSQVNSPKFIESHRLSPFKPRCIDIDVTMDLMIHDLDIILNLVNAPLTHIAANGSAVLSDSIDIAQARLTFADGCVANVTASRISEKSKRKMHIFQHQNCICVDFQALHVKHFSRGVKEQTADIPEIQCSQHSFQNHDALHLEIDDLLSAILNSRAPTVSSEDGIKALNLAHQISKIIIG